MIHGVINVYKEKGFTSHDVVAKLRGITRQKKVGHTGTLDPDARGVLPVCCGKATKLCDMLTDKDKVYETVLLLGKATDTQDVSGTVLEEGDSSSLSKEEVSTCITSFVGEYEQVPPMYSALKVNGKKLYELAREGKTVEREARKVHIFDLQILKIDLPRVRMRVHCSKGTYIRTLCHDIGEKLGCKGCMEELLRTRVERFVIEDSHTLGEIEQAYLEGTLDSWIIPIDEMFDQYPKMEILPCFQKQLYNGNYLPQKAAAEKISCQNKEQVRVYDHEGRFVGIYEFCTADNLFHIVKMFLDLSNT